MKITAFVKRIRLRTWIIGGAIGVVVIGGGATWAALSLSASSAQAQTEPASTSVAASLETLEKTVDASGTLAPAVDEDVDFAVAGTVTAVNVTAGSTVTAGDVLATVDTLTVQSEQLSAQATLATAQATLSSAQADDDGSDASAAQIASDEAAVAVAQAAADKAAAAVSGATLTAPVSGLVTAVNLEVGDTVTGSSSGSSGAGAGAGSGADTGTSTAQFTIVGTDSWQVSLSVGETDVPNVASGDQVEFSTDDGASFFGTVSSVGLLPSTTSGAAAYPVTVAVTGSPEGLHDGISVTAKIVYERRTDVLTVPSAAVTTADDGTTSVTVVDADGNETTKSVTVGETVGTLTEITEGLAEGDLVKVTVFTPSGNGGSGGGTGQFPGGGQLPDGFDPSQLPSGVQLPDGFDPSQFGGAATRG
ncbi:efflux RND transporter periplasmic adaptor subunit [Herbiconiux ginsengi]|uniref:Membrane fusion protein, macrolide-specific efflux system n=1 Tax=Herbiconiux ginsengi TaxID=381665 RepID=A0A1H3N375_9MICO|nr:biotin/lipoyl-binding protein [Herbiconiux ginsengi]SDY83387.1 membrane fusion protein, macrolide-specific efflux system [Herbiconiux ginsengi]